MARLATAGPPFPLDSLPHFPSTSVFARTLNDILLIINLTQLYRILLLYELTTIVLQDI